MERKTEETTRQRQVSIRGFWLNPSKWFNPEFLANLTSGSDSYNPAKSSDFQILRRYYTR